MASPETFRIIFSDSVTSENAFHWHCSFYATPSVANTHTHTHTHTHAHNVSERLVALTQCQSSKHVASSSMADVSVRGGTLHFGCVLWTEPQACWGCEKQEGAGGCRDETSVLHALTSAMPRPHGSHEDAGPAHWVASHVLGLGMADKQPTWNTPPYCCVGSDFGKTKVLIEQQTYSMTDCKPQSYPLTQSGKQARCAVCACGVNILHAYMCAAHVSRFAHCTDPNFTTVLVISSGVPLISSPGWDSQLLGALVRSCLEGAQSTIPLCDVTYDVTHDAWTVRPNHHITSTHEYALSHKRRRQGWQHLLPLVAPNFNIGRKITVWETFRFCGCCQDLGQMLFGLAAQDSNVRLHRENCKVMCFLGDLRWVARFEPNRCEPNRSTYRQPLPKVCLQHLHGQDEDWFRTFWALLVHFGLGIMREEGICQIWIFRFLRSKRSNLEV